MDNEKDHIIPDVRTQTKYDDGHIKCAMLIPDYELGAKAESILSDKISLFQSTAEAEEEAG